MYLSDLNIGKEKYRTPRKIKTESQSLNCKYISYIENCRLNVIL